MDKEEYTVTYLKHLKNIDLNLSRIATMLNDLLFQEYGVEYTYHDDDEIELPNIPPCSDGDDDND